MNSFPPISVSFVDFIISVCMYNSCDVEQFLRSDNCAHHWNCDNVDDDDGGHLTSMGDKRDNNRQHLLGLLAVVTVANS